MWNSLSHSIIFVLFLVLVNHVCAQEKEDIQTISIKKQLEYAKAAYDNVNNKLIALDRFGNPHEGVIKGFNLYIKGKRKTYNFSSTSDILTKDMLDELKKLKTSTKLFFTKIMVEEKNGHLNELPELIELYFPECKTVK